MPFVESRYLTTNSSNISTCTNASSHTTSAPGPNNAYVPQSSYTNSITRSPLTSHQFSSIKQEASIIEQTIPEKDIPLSSMNPSNEHHHHSQNHSQQPLGVITQQKLFEHSNLLNQQRSNLFTQSNYAPMMTHKSTSSLTSNISSASNDYFYLAQPPKSMYGEPMPNYQTYHTPQAQYIPRTTSYHDDFNMRNLHIKSNVYEPNYPALPLEETNPSLVIERLRTRVQFLEMQLNANPMPMSPLNRVDQNIKSVSALLNDQMGGFKEKENLVTELENKLNEREYEISELKSKFKRESAEWDHQSNKFRLTIEEKDRELLDWRSKGMTLQKECDSLKSRVKELDSYLASLPTQDEVNFTNKRAEKLTSENADLQNRLQETEKKVTKAKYFIKEKLEEINSLKEDIKKKDVDREKLQMEYDNYKALSYSVNELVELREENAKNRAEIETARKLLVAHKDQMAQVHMKHSEETSKLREQVRLETEGNIALRKECDDKEKKFDELKSELKSTNTYNQLLVTHNVDLEDKLKAYEAIMDKEYQKLLRDMCKELDVCTERLNSLIGNCIKIVDGDDNIDLASLISNPNYVFEESVDDAHQVMNGILSSEYLLGKLGELAKLKMQIDAIRRSVSDKYAGMIGRGMACPIQ